MTGNIAPIGVGTAILHPKQASSGAPLAAFAAPGNANPPILFEPPPGLTDGANEVWVLATGGTAWGGCQIWVSSDGSTYALAGTVYRGGRQGLLGAALPAHADPDTADTLAVDLAESDGQLLSGTQADADNFVTLCYCDGELVSYETATLTALYNYNLTYLRRGVYGTPIGPHMAGTQFGRLGPNDPALFRYPYPGNFVGQTISVKLPSFNIFGQQLQDLASLPAYAITLNGAGNNPLASPIIAALAAGTDQDWGMIGTSLIGAADFGMITVAVGATVNFGTIP